MVQAFIYGGVSGFALLFGAAVGTYFNLSQRAIARFMAFGAGVLICALTFGLMEGAFLHGGFDAVIIGFLLGGAVFIAGDYLLHIKGGRRHKRKPLTTPKVETESGKVITLGAVLDGVPESIALGISLFATGGQGLLMLAAITLSNFPEGISSVPGLEREGFSKAKIYGMWTIVASLVTVFTLLSFSFLHNTDPNTLGIIEAFAAGAILAMLADSLMPEAFEEGGFSIGIVTVLGFLTAFILSKIA